MTDISLLMDRVAIADLVDAVFDTVDAKDWPAVEALFEDRIHPGAALRRRLEGDRPDLHGPAHAR